MLELPAQGDEPSAFLRVGGVSVARHQVGLALALNCERIVCLARGLLPPLVELQHIAEKAGAQFHVIPNARGLSGLITATDDVFVLGDGLFASVDTAALLLEKGPGVLVQPIEQGLAAGFERIDLNSAAAGAMRLPGRLIERLAELPSDCDVASALQRIALQSGVPQRPIPSPDSSDIFWALVRSENEAQAIEPRWIKRRTRGGGPLGPGRMLARAGVRALGPALLHGGSGAGTVLGVGAFLGLLGLGAGWFNQVPAGLALCALGWVLYHASGLLARIESDAGTLPSFARYGQAAYGWLLDIVIVGVTALAIHPEAGRADADRLFPPFILIALLRILPRATGGKWLAWIEDRMLLCLILAGSALAGAASEVVHIGAVLLALAGILVPRGELQLTRT